MKTLSLSFEVGGKTVTVGEELSADEEIGAALARLRKEIETLDQTGRASLGQLRALYARATAAGWEKSRVKEYLEKNLGTAVSDEIVGAADRREISRLIDGIGISEVPGKATAAQMRILWAKALNKGWAREQVRSFLQEKVGAARDEQIIGCIDQALVERAIKEIAAA